MEERNNAEEIINALGNIFDDTSNISDEAIKDSLDKIKQKKLEISQRVDNERTE